MPGTQTGLVPDSITIALARVQSAVVALVKQAEDEKLKSELQDLGPADP